MKKYFKTILLGGILLAAVGLVACEDYLEKSDESIISEKEAFKDFTNFQGFTEELYNCVVDFSTNYWTNSFNWGDDEITSTAGTFHFIHKIDDGNFWGWQKEHDGWHSGWMDQDDFNSGFPTPDNRTHRDLWNAAWYGIRKANIGLANMDKLTATAEEKALLKGQLLFFRGWFHHRLMEYFGGLPYINEVLPSGEPLRLPRLTYQACADSAAKDLREAADLLPLNWDDTQAGKRTLGKNKLRINKIMALGYLGKNYLWAGSPLMNYESTGSKSYDADYCKKAAEAFAELLQLSESGQAWHQLLDFSKIYNNFYTYGQNWEIPGGTEVIFQAPTKAANNSNWGTSKQYIPSVVGDGDLKFLPTANYVNANYGMKNGLPISDPQSGYDPTHPWKDRDPRFYSDIIFDGVKVVQGSIPADLADTRYANLYTIPSNLSEEELKKENAKTYRNVSTGSRTGYVLRKFIPLTSNKHDRGYDYSFALHIKVPYMRLADIYLMYAEAALMGYGSPSGKAPGYSKSAVDAINVIRDRAGVDPVADKFLASSEAFLGEVRRERAVELSFESHRFNDLRRWLLLIESPYTLKTSLEFDRVGAINTEDPTQNQVANLREVVILERNFSEKHYWLPLKVADVSIYPEFKQNPGW
ncbi:putative outer membrane starch-binding protein [Breznakibacter xylanolyticus]|uniref:Putative outer membrane starch-binding protein n=1 Tax=Breznakibacter xylanolyticus TaxID=990 RepID=A0A2W7NGD8_9BACT|nr:RagB/SusD family nutrient uptake outer membrane protein [Breznakibacter xylanolyticus]PZX17247.1 putative outer membrane starch-binding protein [Breznakibacter xylanolyticus]